MSASGPLPAAENAVPIDNPPSLPDPVPAGRCLTSRSSRQEPAAFGQKQSQLIQIVRFRLQLSQIAPALSVPMVRSPCADCMNKLHPALHACRPQPADNLSALTCVRPRLHVMTCAPGSPSCLPPRETNDVSRRILHYIYELRHHLFLHRANENILLACTNHHASRNLALERTLGTTM